jgi:hypothetical protein
MKLAIAGILCFALIAFFGCTQTGSLPVVGATSFDKVYTFETFSGNNTSASFATNTVIPIHAFNYQYINYTQDGNWTAPLAQANLSFYGSLDDSVWTYLGGFNGSTNGTIFIVDKPVNNTINVSKAAVIVKYVGTG